MNNRRHIQLLLITTGAILLTFFVGKASLAEVNASYEYQLANFRGPVPSLWAKVTVDLEQGEIYTLNRQEAAISIYNNSAMQLHEYGEELELAAAADITSDGNGGVYVLYRSPAATVRHLDYRGQTIGNFQIEQPQLKNKALSPEFIDFVDDKIYLTDPGQMRVVVSTTTGEIITQHDLREKIAAQIKGTEKNSDLNKAQQKKITDDLNLLSEASINGFSADNQGALYFTVPTLFSAYRLSTDGHLQPFGIPGSAPGKFGVVASIDTDNQGNIYVSDRLRSVILIFDKDLSFLSEFGYRGTEKYNLVVPDDIAVDSNNGRIYVSQAANRGVSVFQVTFK